MKKALLFAAAALAGIILFSSLAPPQVDAQTPGGWVEVFIDLPSRPSAIDRSVVNSFGGDERYEYRTSNTIAVRIPADSIAHLRKYSRFAKIRPVPTAVALEDTLDWGVDQINGERVWGSGENAVDIASGHDAGAGVKVGIIDTGIDSSHSDLSANVAGGWNFVSDNSNFSDNNSHGTHVSGTVAARDNESGVIGVAPQASLYGLKVLDANGNGSYADIIAAIEWATGLNGGTKMDVVNMSFGCYYAPNPSYCDDPTLHSALDYAYSQGVVLVAAAGNSGSGSDTVGYPAQYSSVIAIAATTSSNGRASFSSTGPDVELAAPGSSIRSTIPGNSYDYYSGTSMAAPHVAGAVALIKAANPGLSPSEIRGILQTTAIDLGSSGRDNSYGYGLIQADLAVDAAGGGGGGGGGGGSSTTGSYLNCSSQGATSGGDNDGYESNADNACADGGGSASDNNSGTYPSTSCSSSSRDRHVFYNYNTGVAADDTIEGIEVRVDASVDRSSSSYSPQICVQLSWDGGSSWTSAKQTPNLSTGESSYILGSDSDNWGHSWTGSQLSNSNLRIMVTDTANSTYRDFRLDWVTLRVTTSAPAEDNIAPTVQSVSPANNASNVPVGSTISATFSEDVTNVTGSTFTVETTSGGTPVAGNVSVAGNVATFTPSSNLAGATGYTARLSSSITDTSGNPLGSNYSWQFTTVETVPPTVSSTSPANNAVDVPVGADVSATFSENIASGSVTSSSFTLTGPGGAVSGSRSVAGNVVTFNPASNLASETEYTASLTTAITDLVGNHLVSTYSWSFTTEDALPPTVNSTSPADNATGVDAGANISATFSEDIDPSSITSSSFTLVGNNGPVDGARSVVNNVVTFNPTDALASETEYTATLTTTVTDLAGNQLVSSYIWSFTTEDVDPPGVSSTSPADNATGVAVDTEVSATFDEAMAPNSLSTSSFTLTGPGNTPVSGSVSYDAQTDTATFTPSNSLAENTQYTAALSTAVTDEAGNPLPSTSWVFTTAADDVPPVVQSVAPVNGANNVGVSSNVSATFNEELDPTTLSGHFTVTPNGGSAISGVVTYNNVTNVVTFNPASDLASTTTYTAVLTTDIKDVAGNNLASQYQWSFTTADVVPPTVSSTSPAGNATNVALGANITATFSEALSAASINNSTFTLTGPGGSVAGSRSYSGGVATFNPTSNLAYNTTYTATLTTGVEDVAGNNLVSQYQWSFTTIPDTTQPTVISTSPASNATDVPIGSTISATFSEAMNAGTLAGNFQVRRPDNSLVAGSVSYNGTTATFTPTSDLDNATIYTVTLTTAITDAAGNPLDGNQGNGTYVWSFTMENNLVACTAPVIVSSSDSDRRLGGAISITWQPVPGATEYTVELEHLGRWYLAAVTSSTSYSGSEPYYDPGYRVYVTGGTCTGIPGPATVIDP